MYAQYMRLIVNQIGVCDNCDKCAVRHPYGTDGHGIAWWSARESVKAIIELTRANSSRSDSDPGRAAAALARDVFQKLAGSEGDQGRAKRSRHIRRDVMQLVYSRDEGKCVECGSNEDPHFDHIIPFSRGGSSGSGKSSVALQGV